MGDIDIKGSESYVRQTRAVLETIESNPIGQVIVSRIRGSKKDLTIVPYTEGGCDSSTEALDPEGSAPKGASADGPAVWYAGFPDDPRTRNIDERTKTVPRTLRGTGEGSDVKIYYSPDIWGPTGCFDGKFGAMSDEALFHEMVHCLRDMQGKYNPMPTGDNFTGYGNEEEFLAVVVTNVYMSASGGTELREDHTGHNLLKPPLNTSDGFLRDRDNWRLMNIYRLVWTDVFNSLSFVGTGRFNPFRELNMRCMRDGTFLWR